MRWLRWSSPASVREQLSVGRRIFCNITWLSWRCLQSKSRHWVTPEPVYLSTSTQIWILISQGLIIYKVSQQTFKQTPAFLQTFGYNFEVYSKVAPQNCNSLSEIKKKKKLTNDRSGFWESAVQKREEEKKHIQVFFTSPFSGIRHISAIVTVFFPSIPILKLWWIMPKCIFL